MSVSYTPDNWNADTDSNLYLYLTKENHNILVNDQAFNVKWDDDTSKFTYEWAGTDVITKINAIGTVDTSGECKSKIEAARTAYDKLTATDKTFVGNSSALTTAENTYAAKVVDKKIEDLGEISGPEGLDKETAVKTARSAYNALTSSQKKLVTKLSTLETAETKITELKADKSAADDAITNINDIGTPVTLESKAKISIARDVYDALTARQKKFITAEQLKTLTDAEAEYTRLYDINQKEKADKAAAKGVMDIIDTINTPVTLADKTAVKNANTAYNALTDDQKAYVTEENKTKLINAVSTLETLMKPVNSVAKHVNDLPAVTDLTGSDEDMNEAILAAEAYDNLSELEKSVLPAGTVDKLNAVKNKLATINHTSNGVTVDGLDWWVRVVAEKTSSGDSFDEMKNRADKKGKELVAMYGIKLQRATLSEKVIVWEDYGLDGTTVKVSIVNDRFNDYGKALAIHEMGESEYEDIDAVISGNTASFETNSFSNYGITGEKIIDAAAQTGDNFNIISLIVILLIAATAGATVIIRRKRS
ncbi:MAG: hypothetical protein GX663_03375 [Clostridiales bacterium]|nr:hypothetical protein [Clostridiales bacterium]